MGHGLTIVLSQLQSVPAVDQRELSLFREHGDHWKLQEERRPATSHGDSPPNRVLSLCLVGSLSRIQRSTPCELCVSEGHPEGTDADRPLCPLVGAEILPGIILL